MTSRRSHIRPQGEEVYGEKWWDLGNQHFKGKLPTKSFLNNIKSVLISSFAKKYYLTLQLPHQHATLAKWSCSSTFLEVSEMPTAPQVIIPNIYKKYFWGLITSPSDTPQANFKYFHSRAMRCVRKTTTKFIGAHSSPLANNLRTHSEEDREAISAKEKLEEKEFYLLKAMLHVGFSSLVRQNTIKKFIIEEVRHQASYKTKLLSTDNQSLLALKKGTQQSEKALCHPKKMTCYHLTLLSPWKGA